MYDEGPDDEDDVAYDVEDGEDDGDVSIIDIIDEEDQDNDQDHAEDGVSPRDKSNNFFWFDYKVPCNLRQSLKMAVVKEIQSLKGDVID